MIKEFNTTMMLKHLEKAILMSGGMPELESLEHVDENTVNIHYSGGSVRPVSIHCDSNLAVMRDILREV